LREGQRLAESIEAEEGAIVILGFGLGYAAQMVQQKQRAKLKQPAILNNENKPRPVIVVEKHKSLLLKAFEHRDFTDFLDNNRIIFIAGGTGEGITTALNIANEIIKEHNNSVGEKRVAPSVIRNKALISLDEPWYKAVDDRIRAWSMKDDVNTATHKRFGVRWARNITRNISALRDYPGISRLAGLVSKNCTTKHTRTFGTNKYEYKERVTDSDSSVIEINENLPVFLAAAGPSLDKIKPLLRDIHERCVIVAVDTSLRFFIQNGVQPDFTVVVDPQFWNSRHLDRCVFPPDKSHAAGQIVRQTALIAEPAVYPQVLRLPFKNKFVCSSMFALGAFIEKKVDPKGKLGAGGSVATSAWDFARILGGSEIWIAGLDLSFPNLKTHFRGARFESLINSKSNRFNPAEKWIVRALRDGIPLMGRAASGEQVLTDRRLSLYAAWFENQFSQHASVKNFCLFQEGLNIKGLHAADTEKLLALPPRREEIDRRVREVFSQTEIAFNNPEEKQRRTELYENAINELKNGMENIKNDAARGEKIARDALKATHEISGSINLSQQEKIYKELNAITQNINESSVKEITDFLLPLAVDEKENNDIAGNDDPFKKFLISSLVLFSGIVRAVDFYKACII
ncbi:MAG: DUF115 domain-containing protein, partial [Treponema sp.]|nr:DUF115 domain-containing protein [Treponema sp.]